MTHEKVARELCDLRETVSRLLRESAAGQEILDAIDRTRLSLSTKKSEHLYFPYPNRICHLAHLNLLDAAPSKAIGDSTSV